MFKIKIKDKLLLTGAGFTKNFGGFLGDDMWSLLFNNPAIQASPLLRERLLGDHDFDYESVYSDIVGDSNVPDQDRKKLTDAVHEAYRTLDDAIVRGVPTRPDQCRVEELIGWFGGDPSSRAIIFTLNQDLWFERQLGCNCPGVPPFPDTFIASGNNQVLECRDFRVIEENNIDQQAVNHVNTRGGYVYLKLHGSYGWAMPDKPDQLVLGIRKEETIKGHPLLNWYYDVFKWAIRRPDQKLLIIGYGFRDSHINRVLVEGIKSYGLRIFIIDPQSPREFIRRHIENWNIGVLDILSGIGGYYPYSLHKICPSQDDTVHFASLRNTFKP